MSELADATMKTFQLIKEHKYKNLIGNKSLKDFVYSFMHDFKERISSSGDNRGRILSPLFKLIYETEQLEEKMNDKINIYKKESLKDTINNLIALLKESEEITNESIFNTLLSFTQEIIDMFNYFFISEVIYPYIDNINLYDFEDKFYYRVSLPLIFNRFNGEVKELILDPEPAQKLELERLSIISNYVLLNIVKKQKKAFREFHQKMKSINIGGV